MIACEDPGGVGGETSDARTRPFAAPAALVLVAAAWWLVCHPTEFGQQDQSIFLPHVYRLLDPGYLPNDEFLNEGPQHIAFTHAAAVLARFMPLERAMYVLRTVQVLAVFTVLMAACHVFFRRPLRTFVIATIFFNYRFFQSAEGYYFFTHFAGPVPLAWPAAMGAFLAAIRGRIVWSAGLMVVGTLFHPLIGGQTLVGIVAAQLFTRRARSGRRTAWTLMALSAGFIAGALPLMLRDLRLSSGGMTGEQFVYILCHVRHPQHTIITSFGAMRLIRLAMTLSTAIVWLLWLRRREDIADRVAVAQVGGLYLGLIATAIAGFVLIEWLPTTIGAKLYPYRCLVYFDILGALCAASVLGDGTGNLRAARKRGFAGWFGLILIAAAALALTFVWVVRPGLRTLAFQLTAAPILLTVWGLMSFVPRRPGFVAGLTVALAAGVFATDRMAGGSRLAQRLWAAQWNRIPPARMDAYLFIQDHCPPDATVMIGPNIDEFRAFARRRPYFDFKCFPFSESGAMQWHQTYLEVPDANRSRTEWFDFCISRRIDYLMLRFESPRQRDEFVSDVQPYAERIGAVRIFLNDECAVFQFNPRPT